MEGQSEQAFLHGIGGFLGVYYLFLAAMNGTAAYFLWIRKSHAAHAEGRLLAEGTIHDEVRPRDWTNIQALFWLVLALVYVILAPLAMSGAVGTMPGLPDWFRNGVDYLTGPVVYSVGTSLALVVLFVFRRFFVKPFVAWAMLNIALLLMGLAMSDRNFAAIVTKPDNVPIVGLVYLLGFFTWLSASKAVKNDDRIAQGLPPLEKLDSEKTLVWPDLVYTELICMIALTAFLLIWAIYLKAPLEEPANAVKTPNPSKAPWYFLGLQEMLVYFDPWYAGVVLPSMVIFGLMAIPYLDFNKRGNGYYTIAERKFSYLVFQFGFLELWITLIVLGTFLRGPNWNIFGPFEHWDAHKVEVLNNMQLSEAFWVHWLKVPLPHAPTGAGTWTQLIYILEREAPGIIAVLFYFIALPPIMATTIFRSFFARLGFVRYMIMSNLFLLMLTLPLKMVLRWMFNLKYLINIPEYFLNF